MSDRIPSPERYNTIWIALFPALLVKITVEKFTRTIILCEVLKNYLIFVVFQAFGKNVLNEFLPPRLYDGRMCS